MLKFSQMEEAIHLYYKVQSLDDDISQIDQLAAKLVNGQFTVRLIVEDTTPIQSEPPPESMPGPDEEDDPSNARFVPGGFVITMPPPPLPPDPNQPGFMPQHPFVQMMNGLRYRTAADPAITEYEFPMSEAGIMPLLQTMLTSKQNEREEYVTELAKLGVTR